MKLNYEFKPNTIYCGDNFEVLSCFPSESVDLIYLDPPFFSNKKYEVIWEDGFELRCFEDRWQGGIEHYLGWMRPRIEQIHRVLKNTGSFYLHCDYHANAHLRIMCNDIFGKNNFQNEIIWSYGARATIRQKGFSNKHDTLLLYSKGKSYTYNQILVPYKDKNMKRYNKIDKNGKKYALIKRKRTDGTVYYGKCYAKEGVPATSVWDIPTMSATSGERLGYPTQKPESLLERIIKASSNPMDIVLDPFCGCGTTLAVAKRLGRRFMGIDVSPTACKLMAKRINYKKSNIVGMKYSLEQLKELPHFEFQNWVCERIGGKVNPRKTGDLGIDGIVPLSEFGANLPIEVKQHKISRPDVDKFETVLRRTKKKAGFMVAFEFSKGAIEEIARTKNMDKLKIIPVTIQELLQKNERLKKKQEKLGAKVD